MRKRSVKSVKNELIKKSREAVIAAVQIYNNPSITFKAETYITLIVIGWTYLLHAYYRCHGIDYRYYKSKGNRKIYHRTKYGAFKHWELEQCLNDNQNPLDKETTLNLKYLIGIRHEIEQQMTNKIDEYLSAKLQACAINFDYYMGKLFGEKNRLNKELSLAIQFSPITPEQKNELYDNSHIVSNIRNFVTDFENGLSDDIVSSPKYAYRVLFVPITAKRKGQADQVIEFIKSDSPMAEGLKKQYALIKETEKKKYLPSEIVKIVRESGYPKFSIKAHTRLWKGKDAKNPKKCYGVQVSKTWYWYENWLQEVMNYCEKYKSLFVYRQTNSFLLSRIE